MVKSLIIIKFIIAIGLISLIFFGCEKEEKNTAPSAVFTITPDSGTIETVFTFDASACHDEEDDVSVLQVRWDWENDGLFDTDFSVNKVLEHQYTQPGTYHVTMEVRDSKASGNVMTKSLMIKGILPLVILGPISNITGNSATCAGVATTFTGSSIFARGFCWSTATNPSLSDDHTTNGTGIGSFTGHLAGLEKKTKYYVRAYATNEIGTGYSDTASFTTPDAWFCGDPFTILHAAGNVAPVSKTVTYGTVIYIAPAIDTLCWITSNLGADHQATAVDDATEASAGWYWQFNRKQGYYHDGINRIPGTAWVGDITEDTDWVPGNDPCALELGSGWRIPAQSELVYTDQWEDWTGPWNSPLKLHAAGGLDYITGERFNAGSYGYFWSNLQGDWNTGWYIRFSSTASTCAGNYKAYALTLRCVKE